MSSDCVTARRVSTLQIISLYSAPALILLPKRICSATYSANLSIFALFSELSVKAALPSVIASAMPSSMPSSSHTGSAIYGDAPMTATYLPLLFATAHVSTGKSVDWFLWLKYTTPFAFFGTITDTSTSRVVLGSAANSSKSIIPAL